LPYQHLDEVDISFTATFASGFSSAASESHRNLSYGRFGTFEVCWVRLIGVIGFRIRRMHLQDLQYTWLRLLLIWHLWPF